MSERRGKTRLGRRMRRALRWSEHVLAMLGLLFIVYHCFFDVSVIVSGSMSPTLNGTSRENGDWVLTEKISYLFRKPRRWEVATFRTDDGQQVMKRVAGRPGETLTIVDKMVRVDGQPAPRPDSLGRIEYYAYGLVHKGKAVDCEDGYFMLGDRSTDSQDSRFDGPVQPSRIAGRAWLVIWPLSRVGFVSP